MNDNLGWHVFRRFEAAPFHDTYNLNRLGQKWKGQTKTNMDIGFQGFGSSHRFGNEPNRMGEKDLHS